MNHKRGKPKSSRAGCLLCKPHKRQGAKCILAETGNGRRVLAASHDMRAYREARE